MAIPSIRWLRRITGALVTVIATLALLWTASFWWGRLSLPWDSRLAVAIAVPAIALLWAIWWLWWQLPRRQVHRLDIQIHDPKARADTEDNFRKTVGQALGGAAVLIGAGAAYLQFTQQQQASHDLLISNQVSKGFEQIAGRETAMRLGGIYALEGVMNAPSSQYRVPVLEALCALVREGTRDKKGDDTPATDIQAALTVIGRRNPGPGRVDLSGANIPGADLFRADLKYAILVGAHLERAILAEAHLEHADLIAAHLEGAVLTGAQFEGAILAEAHLERAILIGRAQFEGADLGGAHLEGAPLRSARGLTQAQIDQAFGDAATTLPEGLTRPANWPAPAGGDVAPAKP